LAPLPPKPVENELEVRVSPASGTRGVRVMKSMLREPITAIDGVGDMVVMFFWFSFACLNSFLIRGSFVVDLCVDDVSLGPDYSLLFLRLVMFWGRNTGEFGAGLTLGDFRSHRNVDPLCPHHGPL
jgi:hypothetical protein